MSNEKHKTETHKLARGMGRLIRPTKKSLWLWQRWDKRQSKWITTPTNEINRSQAEQFAYQQAAIKKTLPPHAHRTKILFSSVADNYVAARREGRNCKKLRPSSLLKLTGAIRAFERFVGRGYATLLVNRTDASLLKDFAENEITRISPTAVNRNVDFIVQILRFAQDRMLIHEVPKVSVIRKTSTEGTGDNGVTGSAVPTAQEVRQIITHANVQKIATNRTTGHGRTVYDGINANDYSDLFTVLCYTGMRINEAIHLTWGDVDFAQKVIMIRPGQKNGTFWQPKTKHGIRRIAIVPELAAILHRLIASNRKNNWVFESRRGTRLHDCNVQKRFRSICDELGFEKRFTVHSLRKYWASTVAQQGMPWQVMIKMFGHGDFKLILETYYAQNDDARLVQEASKIDFGLVDPN